MIIGAVIDSYGKYGIGNNPIVYDNVDCFGHEKSLAQCSKNVYPNFTCADNNIVGLLCLDSKLYTCICKLTSFDMLHCNNFRILFNINNIIIL